MKFTCEKALLQAAISTTSRAVSPKSSIPALEGILLEAQNDLRLTGYNLETGIRTTVPAEITETGTLVLGARLFGEIVRKLPDDSAIISEEKETGTLGMLRMSNVKAWEYLAGTGFCVFALCMAGGCVFVWAGEYKGWRIGVFLGILAVGILISMFIGAIIGLMSNNQMGATSVTVPVTMVFSFLPMLSLFNEKIREIAKFVYSYQIQDALGRIRETEGMKELIRGGRYEILAVNLLLAAALFGFVYKRCR